MLHIYYEASISVIAIILLILGILKLYSAYNKYQYREIGILLWLFGLPALFRPLSILIVSFYQQPGYKDIADTLYSISGLSLLLAILGLQFSLALARSNIEGQSSRSVNFTQIHFAILFVLVSFLSTMIIYNIDYTYDYDLMKYDINEQKNQQQLLISILNFLLILYMMISILLLLVGQQKSITKSRKKRQIIYLIIAAILYILSLSLTLAENMIESRFLIYAQLDLLLFCISSIIILWVVSRDPRIIIPALQSLNYVYLGHRQTKENTLLYLGSEKENTQIMERLSHFISFSTKFAKPPSSKFLVDEYVGHYFESSSYQFIIFAKRFHNHYLDLGNHILHELEVQDGFPTESQILDLLSRYFS